MSHLCHATGCEREVEPKLLMCLKHWRMVPRPLQRAVWAQYRSGQEDDKRPSREYLAAADAAINDICCKTCVYWSPDRRPPVNAIGPVSYGFRSGSPEPPRS
jgi:hypothetical protein